MWNNRNGATAAEDTTLPPDVVRAVEARADVESLAMLQHQRRQLLETLAPMKAMYGPFGMYDDRRKQFLEAMKVKARLALAAEGGKTTEGMVEANAYADEQYERFLDDSLSEKIEYLRQENQLSDITERISSREAEMYFIGKEMGLTR